MNTLHHRQDTAYRNLANYDAYRSTIATEKPWLATKTQDTATYERNQLLQDLYTTGAPIIPNAVPYTPAADELGTTLSTGLTLPTNFDYMQVNHHFDNHHFDLTTKTYHPGTHDYLIVLNYDLDDTGNTTLTTDTWGLTADDLTKTLRHHAHLLTTTAATLTTRHRTPATPQTPTIAPTATPTIRHNEHHTTTPTDIHFGGNYATLVLEHRTGAPITTPDDYDRTTTAAPPTAGKENWHCGPENWARADGTTLGNEYTYTDPYTAIWAGGALAVRKSTVDLLSEGGMWMNQWADMLAGDSFTPAHDPGSDALELLFALDSYNYQD